VLSRGGGDRGTSPYPPRDHESGPPLSFDTDHDRGGIGSEKRRFREGLFPAKGGHSIAKINEPR